MFMKKFNISLALFFCGSLLLGGCSPKPPKNPVIDDPIPEAKLGLLEGKFLSGSSVLTISEEGAEIVDGDVTTKLEKKSIEGKVEDFSTKVIYADESGAEYSVSWTSGDEKLVEVTKGEDTSIFQPADVSKIRGWYTGWGDVDYRNVGYIVTSEFDEENNLFHMSSTVDGIVYPHTNYFRSSYRLVNNEVKIGFAFFFGSDDLTGEPFEEYYVEFEEETGKIYLMYEGGEDFAFCSAPQFLDSSFTYFVEEEGTWGIYSMENLNFYSLNEEEHTVEVGWDSATEYIEGYDAKGQFIKIGDDTYRGTGYGIIKESEGVITEFPSFDYYGYTDIYDWVSFQCGEDTVMFGSNYDTWEDTLYINDEMSDTCEFAIVDHKCVIKATKDEVEYLFELVDEETALVTVNGVTNTFLDYSGYYDLFINDFYLNPETVISIDYELNVTIGDETVEGKLNYSDDYGIVLEAGNLTFVSLLPENGLFIMLSGDDFFIITPTSFYDEFLGSYTSGYDVAEFTASSFELDDIEFEIEEFTMLTLGTQYYLGVLGSNGMANIALVLEPEGCIDLYQISKNGSFSYYSSFIPTASFEAIIGSYINLDGQYGPEYVKIGYGSLIVTEMNEAGDGIVDVNEEFYLGISEGKVYVEFAYEARDMYIDIEFNSDFTCSIFVEKYVHQVFINNSGVYANGEDILTVSGTSVFYNGEKVTISIAGTNSIFGTCGLDSISVRFGEGAAVTIGENTVNLPKINVSLEDYYLEEEDVSGLGWAVKISEDGIQWHAYGSTEWNNFTDGYTFAYDEAGNLTLTFKIISYTYTVTSVEGVVTIVGESDLPPLPPIPPIPPAPPIL